MASSATPIPSADATARDGIPLTVQSLCNIEFCLPANYILHKPVGKGAYGLVVSATRQMPDGTSHKVAIKKINDVLHDLVDAKRLIREIGIGRHLKEQENIITTVDVLVTRRSANDPDDHLVELAQKDHTQTKTDRHQDSQQIGCNGQSRTVQLKVPGEIPRQAKDGQRQRGKRTHVIQGKAKQNIQRRHPRVIQR